MFGCNACYDRGWLEVSIDGIEPPQGLIFVQRCSACGRYPTDIAAAQAREEEEEASVLAVVCREPRYINYYRCPDDGTKWSMTWSCTCNDRCPTCDHEIEAYKSEDARVEVSK